MARILARFRLKIKNRKREVGRDYRIPQTRYVTRDHSYFKPSTYPKFGQELIEFKRLLVNMVKNQESATFYKFGDGDYYFLSGEEVGSAKPGNRALSKKYSDIDLPLFRERARKNDFYTCEIAENNRHLFALTFPEINPDFPAEFSYGLISNRWLLKQFEGKIGLIGAEPKLRIIESLMLNSEYQDYLGLDKFEDYIYVPQKFACDDLQETCKSVGSQLKNAKSRIFLLGVGHVKSGLLCELPKYHRAVYLDVGSGIDALAGIVDPKRPYFQDWKNFTFKNSKLYDEIDYLQYDGDNRKFIDVPEKRNY